MTGPDDRRRRGPSRAGCALSAAMLGFLAGGAATAQDLATIGRADGVEGRVTVTSHGKMVAMPLGAGDRLFEGDHVETAKDARLELHLEDGSTVQVGGNSALDLEWVLYAPALDSRNVILSMPDGVIRFTVGPMVPRSSFEVKTPTAVTTAEGTDWIVDVRPERTGVLALAGRVAVENVRPDVRGRTVLGPGSGTWVRPGEPPEPAKAWPEKRRTSFLRRSGSE